MGTNTFKNAQSSSVTSETTIYTAPVGQSSINLELDVANTSASTASIDVKVYDNSGGTNAHLVKGANVLSGSGMKVVAGQKIVLAGEDYISVTSDQNVDVVCSILEDVN